ncbi:MAG: hypothetical protein GXZ08_05830 [Tissierellia bacterium]|nr:hypothetical protein [Tissierellia bacterium]
MDTALVLRKSYDGKNGLTDIEINELLKNSSIVQKLTKDYEEKAFFNIFRIMCLAEIPYIEKLDYTQKVIDFISNKLSTQEGFSYTGIVDYVVPCYNAMLLESYTRLGLSNSVEVKNALNWIKQYQVFERNQKTSWKHNGICKHGGCMNSTPCYIGIGKTVRALITYSEYIDYEDKEVEILIEKGINYMLRHKMYQRLSNGKLISTHITDIMFPQAYMLSLTDLVYIANKRKLWEYQEANSLKELLKAKEIAPNKWKIDYIYRNNGYKSFETRRNPSEWIEYLFLDRK